MKKNLVILLLAGSLMTLLVVGGTMAWFTSADAKVNELTAGTVAVEVNEHGFAPIMHWTPGTTTPKVVSVISVGSKKTYIRVSLTPEWIRTSPVGVDLPESNVVFNLAGSSKWTAYKGWYYYKDYLNQGEETENLLASVTLNSTATGADYEGAELRIFVNAEAVQASHQAYLDAWGLTEAEFLTLGIATLTP